MLEYSRAKNGPQPHHRISWNQKLGMKADCWDEKRFFFKPDLVKKVE